VHSQHACRRPALPWLTPFFDEQSRSWAGVYLNAQRRWFRATRQLREIVDLLSQDQPTAWLCGARSCVTNGAQALAVPLPGRPLYRSYLIVPAGDTHTK
jgi:hypothetical protein